VADILDTLRKLYALTDKPEGREEEARTAAWLLIKKAREAGVTIRFVVAGKAEPAAQSTSREPPPQPAPTRDLRACPRCGFPIVSLDGCMMCGSIGGVDPFGDAIRKVKKERAARTAATRAAAEQKCSECGLVEPNHLVMCKDGAAQRRDTNVLGRSLSYWLRELCESQHVDRGRVQGAARPLRADGNQPEAQVASLRG
jgi:hypothetical protein